MQEVIRKDHCDKIDKMIINLLNEASLSNKELLWIIGNICINIGATLEGKGEVCYDDIYNTYIKQGNQTLGNGLMALGADLHTKWISSLSGPSKGENSNG